MPRHRAPTARSSSRSSRTEAAPQSASSQAPPVAVAPSAGAPSVALGSVVRAHGVRGTLVVRLDPSAYGALQVGLPVSLMRGPCVCLAATITRVAPHRAGAAVELDGVSDRDAASALLGCTLVTERTRLPSVQAGEFYACDLIGADAVSPSGDSLGVVVDILATGANDVWIIRGPAGELLVPAVAHAVLEVDTAAKRIVVDPDAATRQE